MGHRPWIFTNTFLANPSGKFHMEVVVLHNAHWITWGRKKYFDNIFPALYETLLPSSLVRAEGMGWEGAR